jgi:hypothetical protein
MKLAKEKIADPKAKRLDSPAPFSEYDIAIPDPDLLYEPGGIVWRILSVRIHHQDKVAGDVFVHITESKADGPLVAHISNQPQGVLPDRCLRFEVNPPLAPVGSSVIDEHDPRAHLGQTF